MIIQTGVYTASRERKDFSMLLYLTLRVVQVTIVVKLSSCTCLVPRNHGIIETLSHIIQRWQILAFLHHTRIKEVVPFLLQSKSCIVIKIPAADGTIQHHVVAFGPFRLKLSHTLTLGFRV